MKRRFFQSGGRGRRVIAASLTVIVVAGIALAVFVNVQPAAAWWNGSWTYRKKITLNNSASAQNLINFPIRVSLSSSNLNYSHAQTAGQDIRFVDGDDTTTLSYEIEKWDISGTSEVWVRVPQIDANSTTDFIWMYYGNGSASDAQNASGVWDSNTIMVHHLEESAACSVTFTDSTANGNNGACNGGGPAANTTGKIGPARTFDGAGDYISVPHNAALSSDATGQTIDLWMWTSSTTTYQTLLSKYNSGGWVFFLFAAFGTCNTGRICYWENSGSDQGVVSGIAANTWTHVAVVKTASTATFYVNGASVGSVSTAALVNDTVGLRIGTDSVGNGTFDGPLDEIHYASTNRSADWIEATYISGNNAMNSFGVEEIYPPEPPILTALGINEALQPTFQLRAADPSDPSYLRYKIQVCSNSDCSSIVRTIDQTSSQTGWAGQDTQSGTAYVASATVAGSTLASHTYQAPALSAGTQYWWRGYAIDPGGSNTWSEASEISTFTTTGPPAAPTLLEPIGGAGAPPTPMLRIRTTDPNGDYVRYKIEICSTSNCSSIVRTIDQTSSQTGWASQDMQSGTAYSASTVLANSQPAVHAYQSPSLTANTQYWWRGYAIDPAGYNQWSSASSIATFTTVPAQVKIQGGTLLKGGTKIGQ